MTKEKELRTFEDRNRKLTVRLTRDKDTKGYHVWQNNFKATHKKLSAANYHFEDLVFQTFLNRLPLSEFVCEVQQTAS